MPALGSGEDIAIIGMACLLPGARDYHAFWSNILAGKNSVADASEEWCNGKFDPNSSDVERIYTKRVGQLGDLAEFDPLEFGVVPNAVPSTEPDHLLALKLAAAALQDSGYDKKPFDRTTTGIILGRGSVPNPSSATAFQHCLALDQTMGLVEKPASGTGFGHVGKSTSRAESQPAAPRYGSDAWPRLQRRGGTHRQQA